MSAVNAAKKMAQAKCFTEPTEQQQQQQQKVIQYMWMETIEALAEKEVCKT